MISDKDNIIVQMVWGAITTLLAVVIAANIITLINISQATINALFFTFVAVFLLKDGLPNFVLGMKEYLKGVKG